MRNRSLKGALILAAGIVAAGVFAPATALADGPLVLNMYVGGKCVEGHKPTDQPITVELLRSDGSTRATRTDTTTDFDWRVCFNVPVAGSKVKMTTFFVPVRTVRIPDLTIAVSRTTNLVKGHAPAGKQVHVLYAECFPSGCLVFVSRTTTANSAGRYAKDLSSIADIDGADEVMATIENSHGDIFRAQTIAPFMEIKARNKIFIGCQPKGTTTITLRRSDGTLRASKSLTAATNCSGENGSFKKNGDPVNVNTGNRIRADFAADASLKWPEMAVNGASSTVSGRCLKNARYALFLQHGSTTYGGTTDGNGEFSVSGSFTFEPGDVLIWSVKPSAATASASRGHCDA